MKVLLLEDNKRLSNLIIEALEEKNYKIDWFEDGKEALKAIYNGYDCFILDINVPGVDGLTLLKELRDMNKTTPAIIISANVELETIKDAYIKGCDEYIKKPFYIYELELKLDKLCKKDNSAIKLPLGFVYDIEKEKLFDEKNEEIKLAKKEGMFLDLFIKDRHRVVTFSELEEYVWEGEETSVLNMRALIKRLRKKLPEGAIEMIKEVGYRLGEL